MFSSPSPEAPKLPGSMDVPALQPPARTTISYRLLGSIAAVRTEPDGTTTQLELGPPKQRAVLGLLLIDRGRIVSTDQFVTALWGEHPPPSALAGLQAYISNLRRILRTSSEASSPIVLRGPGYVLDADAAQLDTTGFAEATKAAHAAIEREDWEAALAAADAALDTWGGALLDDFRDEPWVQAEAAAIEELRTDCSESQITALLALGRVAPAVAAAQKLRAAHPHRDRGCWLLMIALHAAGRSSEALDEYRRHSEALDAELGLAPGAELRELEVSILRHDPELAAWPRRAGWSGAAGVSSPQAPAPIEPTSTVAQVHAAELVADRPALIGRVREQGSLEAAVAEARAGQVRWLVLTGPAGIGKTRLAEELADRVRAAGGREAWARCSDEDGAPAWWPVRQIVRALGEDPDALLVPPPGVDTDEARFVLYERVAAVVAGQASRAATLALVIDDVQWADRTSARCLAHLVGALRGLPVVVALTLREGEDESSVQPLLAALARSDGRRQLDIGPLASAEVHDLAARIATDPLTDAEASELAHHTGGNPLFVSEFARLPAAARFGSDAPFAVRSVLGRRLGTVDDEVMAVLRPAAVLGDVIDIRALSAVTDQGADALADLLDEAADARLLVPAPETGGYAFTHGLLRDEILAGMPALRRQRWHARIAAAFAGAREGDRISQRARHLVAAGPLAEPSDVVEACRLAALSAEDHWSSEEAAEWWGEAVRALDLAAQPEQGELRDELFVAQLEALARAGRGQSVLDVLDAGLVAAMRAGRPDTVGRLAASLVRCAGAWPWLAYGDQPFAMLERLGSLEAFVAPDPAADARLSAALAVGHAYNPDPQVPARLSSRALELAERVGDDAVIADAVLGRLLSYSGVVSHAEECLELCERLAVLGHPRAAVDQTIGRTIASMAYLNLGQPQEAEAVVREAVAASERLGLPIVRVQLRWMQGTLACWHGRFEEARRHNAIGTRVHLQTEISYHGTISLAELGLAREEGTLARASIDGSPEPDAWAAAIAAARGDRAAAESHAVAWLDALPAWTWVTLGHLTLLAHVAADAELPDLARRLLGELEPYAGRLASVGHVALMGPVDLALGRLHLLLGDPATAEPLLDAALALSVAGGGEPSAERCRTALAERRAAAADGAS